MYPQNIDEYLPTDSERFVYNELQLQLPDTFEVFYSVQWSVVRNGHMNKSESDFIITSPEYGYICIEVKGGNGIRIEENQWFLDDSRYGERRLKESPYDQSERSMYYFEQLYSDTFNIKYSGIYGAGVVFPYFTIPNSQYISNRNRECTIDYKDMTNLYEVIKKLYRSWQGSSYRFKIYSANHHRALLELIRKKIAIAAAAGALVQYKEKQLETINRVQNNHIYFITNYRQFLVRGGAGTGKTWIAMKMAIEESNTEANSVLFICASPALAADVKKRVNSKVDVYDIYTLFNQIAQDKTANEGPLYMGVLHNLRKDLPSYDAIFIDEAQDLSIEWAQVIRKMLIHNVHSRLGVFYDDNQILRGDSFGDAFEVETPPFLLHENIRNTSNIYNWAAQKTNLGKDIIANPVEGPTPVTEIMKDKLQLTYLLEGLFKEYLIDERLPNHSLVVIVDNACEFQGLYPDGIAKWKFCRTHSLSDDEILLVSVEEFKGLESDMVIYIHSENTNSIENYIAYTRAKYYLIELIRRGF